MACITTLISHGVKVSDDKNSFIQEVINFSSEIENKKDTYNPKLISKIKKKVILSTTEKVDNFLKEIKEILKKYFSGKKYKSFLNSLSSFWNSLLENSNEEELPEYIKQEEKKLEMEAKNLNKDQIFKKMYGKMKNLTKLWPKLGIDNNFSTQIFKLFLDFE